MGVYWARGAIVGMSTASHSRMMKIHNHCSFPAKSSPSFAKSLFGRVRTCTCDCTFRQMILDFHADKGDRLTFNWSETREGRLTTERYKCWKMNSNCSYSGGLQFIRFRFGELIWCAEIVIYKRTNCIHRYTSGHQITIKRKGLTLLF